MAMDRRRSRLSISVDSDDMDGPPLDQVGSEGFYASYEPKGTLGK